MRKIVLSAVLLMFFAAEASAKRVTLRCARGYSITVNVTLSYPSGETLEFTLYCPQDLDADPPRRSRITVPDGYDEIRAEGNMQGPNGFDEDFELPTEDGNPPGSSGGFAPWPPPRPFRTYQSNGPVSSTTVWVRDPLAPAFIQAGEMLLGEFDDGGSYDLTVALVETGTGNPVAGNQTTSTPKIAASSNSGADGRVTVSLDAGGEYFIRTSGAGYSTQESDEFAMLSGHMWTMVLTPAPSTPVVPPATNIWKGLFGLAVLLVLVLLILLFRRRSP